MLNMTMMNRNDRKNKQLNNVLILLTYKILSGETNTYLFLDRLPSLSLLDIFYDWKPQLIRTIVFYKKSKRFYNPTPTYLNNSTLFLKIER